MAARTTVAYFCSSPPIESQYAKGPQCQILDDYPALESHFPQLQELSQWFGRSLPKVFRPDRD